MTAPTTPPAGTGSGKEPSRRGATPPQLTVHQAMLRAADLHEPYDALGLPGWYCIACGDEWPCLAERQGDALGGAA